MSEKGDNRMCFVLLGAESIAEAGGFHPRDLKRRIAKEGFPARKEGRVYKAFPDKVRAWCDQRYGEGCQ